MSVSAVPPADVESMTRQQLERRRKVTEAVLDLVAESGPDTLQMRDVTARSGVALATLYRYFASKEHLLAAAAVDWQGRLVRQVAAETARRGGGAPGDRVLRFALRGLRAYQRGPHHARLMVGLFGSTDPYASEAVAAMDGVYARELAALMPDVPPPVARAVLVTVPAVVSTGLVGWVTDRKTWPELVRDVEDVTRLLFSAVE
ncbi:TetR family transcriptional regulator [Yinghuangia seranimata]|uniref:TetR family transcriptional regulator n=1 Tax=Yinghuangia seranimata TaxID=408067 RepID=UPI00248B8E42|nr:TetR family transcriptional regulator [Yinghuangia seranimata]MDI2132068.1 TetR family transcriptional regulator [Yinghuangia seranimata]